ncbi:hypothetical protein LCGC14_2469000 [marine sediment metagenome]|uniref:Resolvase/invertase-type recombinase catalytic domain-containing protein n=1 Tax=marine sediment metagenome TaxID=412755 RepID=A0A0F9E4Z0_9ZZZZ
MTTAVYLRVSSTDQSVETQRLRIQKWLDQQEIEVEPSNWYADECSGATMDRPDFGRLQAAVFAGNVDRVVMYSLDRFARTMIDGLVEVDRWLLE